MKRKYDKKGRKKNKIQKERIVEDGVKGGKITFKDNFTSWFPNEFLFIDVIGNIEKMMAKIISSINPILAYFSNFFIEVL